MEPITLGALTNYLKLKISAMHLKCNGITCAMHNAMHLTFHEDPGLNFTTGKKQLNNPNPSWEMAL